LVWRQHFCPYAVEAICALGSAVFIFLTGIEVGYALAGWAAGAAVAMQAFEPGWSSFLVPYSSAAVYSSLFSCAFLWLLLRGLDSRGWWWSATLSLLAVQRDRLQAGSAPALVEPEFSEYGVPSLGRDFNQEFVRFLTSRFRPVRPLVPQQVGSAGTLFVIWQREAASSCGAVR